ncbi:MAG TPA: apolipoprotein N-acyltransferase [Acidimicrobiales bacterium]|jgi:apolipoprotein N-acyltransferase|nr:apolipoprotein N-acyltransferase [Acidimicrobiales bacterium]
MSRFKLVLGALGTGLLLAASIPPWGWWPLAFLGIVALDRLIAATEGRRWTVRWCRGWLVGFGLYLPSLYWIKDLTLPGYLIAVVAYAALFGVALAVVPARAPGRWLALPGAIGLTELLRWSWPFGGVPLSSLAVGQVSSPLAPVLRIGGALLLVELTVITGLVLATALARNWRAMGVAVGAVAVLLIGAAVGPRGEGTGSIEVAAVQGGGEQGTSDDEVDDQVVFERHRDATEDVEKPVDVIVWPEDVVDVEGPVETNPQMFDDMVALAREFDAPIIAGVVEGVDHETFRNASVVVDPDGTITDRYDKVHRVPFGEYVPLRSLIERFAGDQLTNRDAEIGDGPSELTTEHGRFSIAISWEIFFGDRVREGVEDGGSVVLNPTNGSSFTGTLVQTQQIASSRMRAIENDRWVVQVAPTGFSAIIGPDGTVHRRSGISEQTVLQAKVEQRAGTTLYTRIGLLPAWILALISLASGWAVVFVHRRRSPEQTVVDAPQTETENAKTGDIVGSR